MLTTPTHPPTHKHTHTHHDKVITVSAAPCYVVDADDEDEIVLSHQSRPRRKPNKKIDQTNNNNDNSRKKYDDHDYELLRGKVITARARGPYVRAHFWRLYVRHVQKKNTVMQCFLSLWAVCTASANRAIFSDALSDARRMFTSSKEVMLLSVSVFVCLLSGLLKKLLIKSL